MEYFEQEKKEAMEGIPVEFAQFIESQSYERGHSAGQGECNLIAFELANELKPVIAAYNNRVGIKN